ncbi:hypothetical protein K440DRAFT_633353 [Wilcoxina mikolae CBS 423.85]|nr:hypothetical protein K440DRAFT_633353 [Wilcoxina mikolae CBS 423.85]
MYLDNQTTLELLSLTKRLDDEAVKRSVNEVAASGEQRPPVRPPLHLDSPNVAGNERT